MRKTYTGLEMNNLDIHNIDKDKIIEKLSKILDGSFKKALYNLRNDR